MRSSRSKDLRSPATHAPPSEISRRLPRIVSIVSVLVAAAVLIRLVIILRAQLAYPHDIGYESANLATIRLIQTGQPIYAPAVYDDWPFVLTMYTPLYHWLVAQLPEIADQPFRVGRIFSTGCIASIAGLMFLVGRPTRSIWMPLLAVSAMFCIHPLIVWAAYVRPDSLGLLLSVGALLCIAEKRTEGRYVVLAGLLAAGAFMAKQSFLTCSLSCCLFLALHDRRRMAIFIGTSVGAMLAGFAACYLWQGGAGVWFCWFVAPRNPLHWEIFEVNARQMLRQPVFVILWVCILFSLLIEVRRTGARVVRESPFFLNLCITCVALLGTTSKVGASWNNYSESVIAGLLWLVYACRNLTAESLARQWPLLARCAICLAMGFELVSAQRMDFLGQPDVREYVDRQVTGVKREIAALSVNRVKLLNLSDNMWDVSICGDRCLNDPLLYATLWETAKLSDEPLKKAIEGHEFHLILLPQSEQFPSVYMPQHQSPAWRAVVQTVETHYVQLPPREPNNPSIFRLMVPSRVAADRTQ